MLADFMMASTLQKPRREPRSANAQQIANILDTIPVPSTPGEDIAPTRPLKVRRSPWPLFPALPGADSLIPMSFWRDAGQEG